MFWLLDNWKNKRVPKALKEASSWLVTNCLRNQGNNMLGKEIHQNPTFKSFCFWWKNSA
jgi:hypothetical protein